MGARPRGQDNRRGRQTPTVLDVPAKGAYLAIAGGGAILLWSGLRGKSWTTVLRDLISGKKPSTAPNANAIQSSQPVLPAGATGNTATAGAGIVGNINSTIEGTAISEDARKYLGHPYTWGGVPLLGEWDCSSFVNWIVGHDLQLPIPGTKHYDGSTHGPPTEVWIVWTGTQRVAVAATASKAALIAEAGDILVDPEHMGIALGGGEMISALNPQLGTTTSGIADTMFAPTTVLRY
jgi:cell wall-associated NlpC family hydrolase